MIGKPKVMICIGMICLGAFLIHSSDARVAGLQESEVEEELRDELRKQQMQIEDSKIACQIQLEQKE